VLSSISSTLFSATSFFSNYWWSALSAPDTAAIDAHAFTYDVCPECSKLLCTCQRGGDYE